MVSFEDRPGEIIEVGATTLAKIPLSAGLRFIVAMSNNLIAGTPRTAHAFGPSNAAHGFKTLRIVNQTVYLDERSIKKVVRFHGPLLSGKRCPS
jgi:hypothetical protein